MGRPFTSYHGHRKSLSRDRGTVIITAMPGPFAASSGTPPIGGSVVVTSSHAPKTGEHDSAGGVLGSNAVAALTGLALVTLMVTYTLLGDEAAGIAFWAVMFGLPILLAVISALGAAWRGSRRDERLKTALLALRLFEQERASETRSSADESTG